MDERASRVVLSDAERTAVLARFHLLRPAREAGVPLTELAAAEGLVMRTLERWCSRYRRDGLTGLARQPPHYDLRTRQGVVPTLGFPLGPYSGLSVRLPRP